MFKNHKIACKSLRQKVRLQTIAELTNFMLNISFSTKLLLLLYTHFVGFNLAMIQHSLVLIWLTG